MWELHAVLDRFLSFVAFQRHVFFFYVNILPESFDRDEQDELEPPSMLQRVVRVQRRYDAYGRSMTDELRAVFSAPGPRIQSFEYTIHPMFIQNTSVFVPLTYLSPAIRMLVVVARVCKACRDSLTRILKGRFMLDFHSLLASSQCRCLATLWIHRPWEDRFRVSTELISEIKVLTCRFPLCTE